MFTKGDAISEIMKIRPDILRCNIFLQSKFTPINGQDPHGFLPYDPSASLTEQVHQSFKTTLKNLQTHYLGKMIIYLYSKLILSFYNFSKVQR